ncbi:DUF3944 domain-containing protein [Aliarcobacter skirrowii]|uniref:DUF3944 domain-containing protein n=1 Tax=Aliarcobacter skirrowii TaxID=28200 RepID=UPI000831C27D|nr:DUF3944 domain-containing protein [Aliarcobacter skirrowii]MDX4060342.1 DUF3944 domain-containing protein [Aliarcobacter skirrowii]
MAYREDIDLAFLAKVSSEDLEDLVYTLTHDKDGKSRWTEELTKNERYKTNYPEHNKYWEEIAAEIQCFGGNTLATAIRGGKGVLYKEVLIDVCKQLKVNFNKDSSVETIESNLLMKILSDAVEKMTPEEINELALSFGMSFDSIPTKQIILGSFQAIFKVGGFKSYQLTVTLVNAILKAIIGRGLSLGGNVILTRSMSIIAGPIGWVITGIWTAVDLAGTAYRVTIPSVITIAVLRQKKLYELTESK